MQKSSQIRSHTAHIFPKKKEKPVSSRGLVEGSELHRFPSVFLLQLLEDVSSLSARSIIHIKRRVSLIPCIMGRNTHFIIQLLTSAAPQRDHSAPAGEFALPHARWTAEKNSNWATRMWARTDAPDAGEFRVSFTCVSRDGACSVHTHEWFALEQCVPATPIFSRATAMSKRIHGRKCEKTLLPQNSVRGIRVWRILQHAVKWYGTPLWHYIYIYAFSRRFYPKRLTLHSGYTFLSVCVPWELNPPPFALLTQCSTTEPQEHIIAWEPTYTSYIHVRKSVERR